MSLGSQALERSALEAKDRDSLLQIATAMGGKPGSRAKKADIIDLILTLAGVTPAAAPADVPDTDTETDTDTAAADEDAVPAPPPAGRGRTARSTAGREDDTATADRATDEAAAADRSNDDHRSSEVAAPRDDRRGPEDANRSTGPSDPNRTAGDDAGADASGQPNGSGPREDGESGNRRRRRRGRDRDRNREGGQPGQPGAAPALADDQWQGEPVEVSGLLDLREEGYGFLRLNGYLPSRDDVYVSVKQVRQFGLRKGDHIKGASRPAARNEKNPALLRIDEVNEGDPELNRDRRHFDDLTALHPDEPLPLETAGGSDPTPRLIDLLAPVAKGQRGLIVAPPKSGTTTIVTAIAQAIEANHPDVHVMVLLVDERPEEVTAMARATNGEVVASTFDRPAEEHAMVAELALERAKRLVEEGKDVAIIFDGLTRLARAYNLAAAAAAAGRVPSGGIETGALYAPKKFYGAARKAEEGGSLTILATALVETGSAIDEAIFEEFAGTANMELRLDRRSAERRIFPAIDVVRSSTGHEELLFDGADLPNVQKLRRLLTGAGPDGDNRAALDLLLERIGSSPTNEALLAEVAATSDEG